jgi:hypothetical protein
MNNNIHDKCIPKEIIDQALGKLDEVSELLRPYFYPLTPEQRKIILKLGDKSIALGEKTSELAITNPQFCPSYFNIEELKIDLADLVNLRTLLNRLQQLTSEVDDTMMLSGNEAFIQVLSFYNAVKQAARDNQPGAKTLFDELKKRFVIGRPKKTTNDE